MTLTLGALLFIVFGLLDLGAGLWAYFGPLEADGAPRGFKNMGKTWHGRGSVCASLPAGIFFLCLGLGAAFDNDALRTLFLYFAGVSVIAAIVFLFRSPAWARPAWLRDKPQV
jgi:hypothetical protein